MLLCRAVKRHLVLNHSLSNARFRADWKKYSSHSRKCESFMIMISFEVKVNLWPLENIKVKLVIVCLFPALLLFFCRYLFCANMQSFSYRQWLLLWSIFVQRIPKNKGEHSPRVKIKCSGNRNGKGKVSGEVEQPSFKTIPSSRSR